MSDKMVRFYQDQASYLIFSNFLRNFALILISKSLSQTYMTYNIDIDMARKPIWRLQKMRPEASLRMGLAVMSGLFMLSGCVSMPDFDRSSDIPPEFQDDLSDIGDFPAVSALPSTSEEMRGNTIWDDEARSILALKADLAEKASYAVSSAEQIRQRQAQLRARLYAYKLDDPAHYKP